jgi:hypothetical protein
MRDGFFNARFLESLPADNLEAVDDLCDEFDRMLEASHPADSDFCKDIVETYAILTAFLKVRNIEFGKLPPPVGLDNKADIQTVRNIFKAIRENTNRALNRRDTQGFLKAKTEEYETLFQNVPSYEFSDQDFARIQVLMNEMRVLIRDSALITDDHKSRLLRRLEAMQTELHKKTHDIDRFWGFIGEAGITIRKFGEDAKPLADRVQELGRIVIAVIMAKEGIKALPEISKLLLPQ